MKSLFKKISTTLIVSSLPFLALARSHGGLFGGRRGGSGVQPIEAPITRIDQVIEIMRTIVGWGQAILLVLAAIMALKAAYHYIWEQDVEKARNILIFAAVGVAVALLAFAITPIVCELLGVGGGQACQ